MRSAAKQPRASSRERGRLSRACTRRTWSTSLRCTGSTLRLNRLPTWCSGWCPTHAHFHRTCGVPEVVTAVVIAESLHPGLAESSGRVLALLSGWRRAWSACSCCTTGRKFDANWFALSNVFIAAPAGQAAEVLLTAVVASSCSVRRTEDLGLVLLARPHTLPNELGRLPHGLLDVVDRVGPWQPAWFRTSSRSSSVKSPRSCREHPAEPACRGHRPPREPGVRAVPSRSITRRRASR